MTGSRVGRDGLMKSAALALPVVGVVCVLMASAVCARASGGAHGGGGHASSGATHRAVAMPPAGGTHQAVATRQRPEACQAAGALRQRRRQEATFARFSRAPEPRCHVPRRARQRGEPAARHLPGVRPVSVLWRRARALFVCTLARRCVRLFLRIVRILRIVGILRAGSVLFGRPDGRTSSQGRAEGRAGICRRLLCGHRRRFRRHLSAPRPRVRGRIMCSCGRRATTRRNSMCRFGRIIQSTTAVS